MKSNRAKAMPPPRRKVALVLFLQGPAGREMLSGVNRFLNEGHLWRLRIIQDANALTADALHVLEHDGVDGLIVSELREHTDAVALADMSVPIAFVNVGEEPFSLRRAKTAFIWNDNEDIGRQAARHLFACGNFAAFGYVNSFPHQQLWSQGRGEAFRRTMEAAGFGVSVYPLRDDCGSPADAAALREWLSSLPKPAAVLAAADWRAVQVFDACQAAGFRIPNQVSLLGVDNNDFDCLGITPQLSSVQPDYEGSGYRAAAELEALMSSTRPEPPRRIYLPARTVVGRGSTKPIPPASVLVRRGLSFIRAHACEGLRVDDVAAYLGASRRLVELRFRQICGKSVRESIENERLERVKRLLHGSDRPIALIAEQTGFKTVSHLSTLFKKRFGVSPRAYRAAKGR